MWELVCGQSAGASLKIAKSGPAFDGGARDVLCPELFLSVGSLRDVPAETGREEILCALYGASGRAQDAEQQARRNRQAVEQLERAARAGEPVRVWTAPAAEEWCLFLWAMEWLQTARGPVRAVCVPLLQPRPDGTLCALRGLGELRPEQWRAFLPLERSVDPAERRAWANLWQAARGESASFRVLFNGQLKGVPEDAFDRVLRESLPARGTFSAGQAVGRALLCLPGVPDGVLAGRLRRWTAQGKLRVRQPAEYYYETVLERTDP